MVDETEFWTVDTVALVGLIMSLLVGLQVSRDPILVSIRFCFWWNYNRIVVSGREINRQVSAGRRNKMKFFFV
jgi:hypothetical protein